MARTIITHVGASALECDAMSGAAVSLEDLADRLRRERDRPGDLTLCVRELKRGLEDDWQRFEPRVARERSPAEIASLSVLKSDGKLALDDQVFLLHPATAGGRFCAALLKQVLALPIAASDYPHIAAAVPLEIPKLRVSGDARTEVEIENTYERFVREGMVNYVRAIWELYRPLEAGDTLVFNITGGYRGMIPIARDLTLLLNAHTQVRYGRRPVNIELYFLFKGGEALVEYHALPVSFIWRRSLVEDLERATGATGVDSRLLSLDKHPEWRPFFTGVPRQPNLQRRSALGEVVLTLAKLLDPGELVD